MSEASRNREPFGLDPVQWTLPEGIHIGVPEETYHADCAEGISASSGVLRTLVAKSPEHAWTAHPKLNPAWRYKPGTSAQNRGTILHSLTLGTPEPYRVLDVAEFRSNADKALKAQALADGLIPVKVAEMEELSDVAASLRNRLRAMPDVWDAMQDAVAAKMTEVSLIWRDCGVLCRCRYDTLPARKFGASYDMKFTGLSAEPSDFGTKVTGDYAFQAAFYPRAVKELRGDRPEFVFIACEDEAPYGVTLHALDSQAFHETSEDIDQALSRWGQCLQSGVWPGYPTAVHYHEVPAWKIKLRESKAMQAEWLAAQRKEITA